MTELGMSGNPGNKPLKTWFKQVSDFAFKNGFAAGMPTGNYAKVGANWVIGVILFNPGSVEWVDVAAGELGYHGGAYGSMQPGGIEDLAGC